MIFFTHLAFALLLSLLSLKYFAIDSPVVFVLLFLLGSVFPDVDIGTSFIGRYFKLVNFFLEHRGFCHSILFMVLSSVGVFLISKNGLLATAFLAGFLSHLLIDAVNYSGVRFFWPSEMKMKGFCKSGGVLDYVLFVVLMVVNIFIVVNLGIF